uniref:Uncharacterized protein n=1 Tax=Cacopsylla melanoneura TaxID=428564 RepID=A0A8D8UU28_9HEMI
MKNRGRKGERERELKKCITWFCINFWNQKPDLLCLFGPEPKASPVAKWSQCPAGIPEGAGSNPVQGRNDILTLRFNHIIMRTAGAKGLFNPIWAVNLSR